MHGIRRLTFIGNKVKICFSEKTHSGWELLINKRIFFFKLINETSFLVHKIMVKSLSSTWKVGFKRSFSFSTLFCLLRVLWWRQNLCISKRAIALDLLKYWLAEAVLCNRIGLKNKKVSINNVQQIAKSNW